MGFIGSLLFPPKCCTCGELLRFPFGQQCRDVLCDTCRAGYEKAKLAQCPVCKRGMWECDCIPATLAESGCRKYIKLTKYTAGGRGAENRMIYYMKRKRNKTLFAFAAKQLSVRVDAYLSQKELKPENVVFAYLPRRRAAVAENGFDQAKMVCECLAEMFGKKTTDILQRSGGREQKLLTEAERRENTKGAFRLSNKHGADIAGKTVVLFDDIVTTGHSMAECMKLLYKSGAEEVVAVSLAYTERG